MSFFRSNTRLPISRLTIETKKKRCRPVLCRAVHRLPPLMPCSALQRSVSCGKTLLCAHLQRRLEAAQADRVQRLGYSNCLRVFRSRSCRNLLKSNKSGDEFGSAMECRQRRKNLGERPTFFFHLSRTALFNNSEKKTI